MTTLEALHLRKDYPIRGTGLRNKTLKAVDDVSIVVRPSESVALVGESGSGKSTIAKMLVRLIESTGGDITLDGETIGRGRRATRAYRSRVQMVFQDPFSSLNPSLPIRHQLARPLRIHGIVKNRAEEEGELRRLLDSVNLGPADEMLAKYPHELSGGQRQRIAIARALAPRPEVLIADEPVSMLDVSIRLEILQLLDELKKERNLAVLYITHDLATARHFSSQIIVMRNGRPYTQLLVRAAPDPKSEPFVIDPERFRDAPDVLVTEADPGPSASGGHWARSWASDPAVTTIVESLAPISA
jgi:peptide/nickel transport system ATP-binding protein